MSVKTLTAKTLESASFDRARYDSKAYVEESSLISHYRFNSNALDSVGVNNLTVYNDPTYVTGQIDNALQLVSSSSQYLKIAYGSQVGLEMVSDFSISCWIKLSSIAAMVICSKNSPSRTEQYSLEIDSSGHVLLYLNNGSVQTATSNTVLDTEIWYHIVAYYDSSNSIMKIFINGVQDVLNPAMGALISSTNDFAIGTFGNSPTNYFNGFIDEFQIWESVLTVDDIYELYLNGIGSGAVGEGYGYGIYMPISTQLDISSKTDEDLTDIPEYANLKGYWRFDGKPIDRSLNGNDLVPQNNPSYVTGQPYASGEGADLELSSSQYFNISTSKQVGLEITGEFTLSAWVKFESLGANAKIITTSNTSGGLAYELFAASGNNFRMLISADGSSWGAEAAAPTAVEVGKWYHVVGVFVPSTSLSLYVNGILVAEDTSSVPAAINDSNQGFAIGANTNGSNYFDGIISEAMVWNTNLSASDIQKLFIRGYMANAHRNGYQAVGSLDLTNVYSTDITKMPQYANLKGYWKMDESAWDGTPSEVVDQTANANHGTAVNSATTAAGGKVDRAGDFEKDSSQYVDVPDSSTLEPTDAVTIAFWAKFESDTASWQVPCYKGQSENTGYGVFIALNINNVELWAGGAAFNTSYALSTGTWYHFAFTYDKANMRIYINGILIGIQANTGAFNYTGTYQNLYIGASRNSGGVFNYYFDGLIDELGIWSVALTPVEINILYLGKAAALTAKSGDFLPQAAEVRLNAKLGESDFSTGAVDSSLMVNSLTDNNTVASLQNGRTESYCADFTSANTEYLHRANADLRGLTLVGQKKVSFFAWIKVKSETSAEIAGCMAGLTGWALLYDTSSKRLEVRINGATGVAYSAANSIIVGKWYYAGFTWNGTLVQCYINGAASGSSGAYSTVLADNSYDFSIGRSAGSSGGTAFDGQIQQATVWATDLTAGQILSLYEDALASEPTEKGRYIELADWGQGLGKVPWGVVRSQIQDLGENGVVSLNKIVFDELPTSGVDIVMRTRSGATPTPDETWEPLKPVNGQRIVDSLESGIFFGTGWRTSDESLIQIGTDVLSGVPGMSLNISGIATGSYVEKKLPTPVSIDGLDFISFDSHSTHSGISLQLQVGTGDLSGAQVLPGVFDIYMASGINPFGEMMTRHFADLRNVTSGANLDPTSIDYLAFKVNDVTEDEIIYLSDLSAGNYLHSGTNAIQSTPQRYVQIESILGTAQ